MPVRMLLSLIVIAFAGAAYAAPAPFARPESPEPPAVELNGSRDDPRLVAGPPVVIASQAAYQAMAAAFGIESAPKVDFRTRILVVSTSMRTVGPASYHLGDD